MDMFFFDRISKSNAGTATRNGIRDFVLQNPGLLPELVAFGTDLNNKNQYKAVWIIEMLAETHPQLLIPFIDSIADVAGKYKHESAIRGISRTILFLAKSPKIALTETQQEKFIEISLDRLIGDDKVAPKVFAMYALSHFSKQHEWIKDELHIIINKDFAQQSAGYKAAAREVLRKI
ncbi:hypothetical protein [Flavobacterium wongokense]|uniref:hypothetical protein n=1 Tax=Flavobacterium wongokense TaxID=2910674 RepID=UPI001F2ACDB3|nr:hypothetical protein [Flavobacterium sp. WG47]MCF6133096.1 hypothetical protein [Flavobacterium sp. WG47]